MDIRRMNDYYSEQLSSNKLKRCYDIAPPRVQQYLNAEIQHVVNNLNKSDIVLELGCGYGRVMKELVPFSSKVIGIDTSFESLGLARQYVVSDSPHHLIQSSAKMLPFPEDSVDRVVCIQNGISAFKLDPYNLIQESVRVTKEGGVCLFSSYSNKIWNHRLEWFKLQADEGLLGEIDWEKTGEGVIECKDGFIATTFTPKKFQSILDELELDGEILEIDESSIFCEIAV
jgi:2-polyprenyl-6-hydroxyphenyl methylase/3-demethylubiquinone-9 3-methyltransferase